MISSMFRNLLKNAVQHNDKEVAEMIVSATDREDTVTVTIADNGPGVHDSQKETVFGKGERRLDSSGTGIRLHLVNNPSIMWRRVYQLIKINGLYEIPLSRVVL
jgi:signal transduction histidine kinase